MPCVSGCLDKKCSCDGAHLCIIRIRSLYRGGFEFNIGVDTTGGQCIKNALQNMGIPAQAARFFGLQHELYGDKYWIDLGKSVFWQLNSSSPYSRAGEKRLFTIWLRIRFYGISEILLDNDIFRNFLFYQLKKDFSDGKLTKKVAEIVSLSAYLLHCSSLTVLSHALPGADFEKRLRVVLPRNISAVKVLVPYVRLALKVIASLTLEQTKIRFIHQCQMLPHYGVEKFTVSVLSNQVTRFVGFSCSGLMLENSRSNGKEIIRWDTISRMSTKGDALLIEFHEKAKRRPLLIGFSNPEDAKRICLCGFTQQEIALTTRWKKSSLKFQPLIHVPKTLLQFDGESDKLSAAINDLFARSSDELRVSSPKKETYFPYASEANIASRIDTDDAFSFRSAEESTLPLIYGSLLAQSTPVLRHHSTDRLVISRAGCASAMNFPHKKRLAASRPLISAAFPLDTSIIGFYGSNQSINEWGTNTRNVRQALSLACVNSDAYAYYKNVSLSREESEADIARRARCMSSVGISTSDDFDEPHRGGSVETSHLGKSDRSASLVFPKISPGTSNNNLLRGDGPRFMSECSLAGRMPCRSYVTDAPLTESADDLTALPTSGSIARTLPASFRRSDGKNTRANRILCFELIQKLHNRQELENEFNSLPSLDSTPSTKVIKVDLGLPVRFLVCPRIAKEDLEHESFWNGVSNVIVLLDAHFLIEKDDLKQESGVLSLFRSDVVSGDHVAIGQIFLSLFSVNRSVWCHTFGIHVKQRDPFSYNDAHSSAHLPAVKTVWLFCWTDDIASKAVSQFSAFVDEIVAVDISTSPCLQSNPTNFSTITVSTTGSSLEICSLYIVSHVLLRTFRLPIIVDCVRSIFDTVAAIRRFLPSTVVSVEQYAFLHELLLRWLEKPPHLI